MRIGLIGAGGVAARHVANLTALGAQVVAVADPDAERAAALAAETGAVAHDGHEALLDAGGLDAVYVCVPPFAHGAPERAVLERGLPLFVEKPLARDLATAEEIAAAVERAGVPTATGYHWRCLPTLAAARSVVAQAPPALASAAWLDKVPPVGWWTRQELSGGQVVEQTTHVLDLLLLLVGDVVEVQALGAQVARDAFPDADVDAATGALLRFASGAIGTVTSTSLLGAKRRSGIELIGEGYALTLDEDELVVDAGERPRVERADGGARRQVDEDFLAEVRGERGRVRAPYAEALRTHRLAWAITEAARTGRTVRVDG